MVTIVFQDSETSVTASSNAALLTSISDIPCNFVADGLLVGECTMGIDESGSSTI
jgi:hypothetical protein